MHKTYRVTLTDDERARLEQLTTSEKTSVRTQSHARILLKADCGDGRVEWSDEAISQALGISMSTVARVRQRFVEEGLEAALYRKPHLYRRSSAVDGGQEAYLLALACSPPPEGWGRWSLRLLADRMVELRYVKSVSHETIRQVLKRTGSGRV